MDRKTKHQEQHLKTENHNWYVYYEPIQEFMTIIAEAIWFFMNNKMII